MSQVTSQRLLKPCHYDTVVPSHFPRKNGTDSESWFLSNCRTRRNDPNKPILGNNSYDRKGLDKCLQCRHRRSKVPPPAHSPDLVRSTFADNQCVYKDPKSPCEFCQQRNISEPCIKGPAKVLYANGRKKPDREPVIQVKTRFEGFGEDVKTVVPFTIFHPKRCNYYNIFTRPPQKVLEHDHLFDISLFRTVNPSHVCPSDMRFSHMQPIVSLLAAGAVISGRNRGNTLTMLRK